MSARHGGTQTRLFDRPRRRRIRRPLPRGQRVELRRANRAVEAGDFPGAAWRFGRLARRILPRNPTSGGWLHVQVGRAWALSGDGQTAMREPETSLAELAAAGELDRLGRLAQRTGALLEPRGMSQEAGWLLERWGGGAARDPERAPRLETSWSGPAKCPFCGATVRQERLESDSGSAAVCAYSSSRVDG
jgi:hypothetical protein